MISSSNFHLANRAQWLCRPGRYSIEYQTDADGNIIAETYKTGDDVNFVIHHEYDADGNITRSYTE